MRLPTRRRPVHLPARESLDKPTIVFVTVCSFRRKPIFARREAHGVIDATWDAARAWLVGRYVILPDHIHFFCAPATEQISLTAWIHYWRSLVSRRWPHIAEQPIWQSGFWDTQLRRGDSYDAKWEYVRNNPVRHGLVSKAEHWPYAGELNTLDW